jgi:hypothetical protein
MGTIRVDPKGLLGSKRKSLADWKSSEGASFLRLGEATQIADGFSGGLSPFISVMKATDSGKLNNPGGSARFWLDRTAHGCVLAKPTVGAVLVVVFEIG